MITENKIIKQISVLTESNTINVQWANQIIKDNIVIAETYERKAYSAANKIDFLNEIPNSSIYTSMMGW